MKKIIYTSVAFFALLSCQKTQEESPFLDIKIQEIEKRIFQSKNLNLEFEKDLEELGILSFTTFSEINDHIVVVENSELVVRYLDKESLTVKKTFSIKKGRGPKELEYIMAFDANDVSLVVIDNQLLKVILFDHQGNLINEFKTRRKPFRVNLSSKEDLNLLYMVYNNDLDSSFIYNIDKKGDVNYEFEKESFKNTPPFSIEGNIKTFNDTLYYVGGYDPYIKKYVRGEKIYSRATIDNYDSSLNYITVVSGESRSVSLSPAAVFSSRDFDVKKGSIFVIPYSNGDKDFSFIDVYASKDGSYIKSFRTIDVPDKIIVYEDERSILTIEKVGELEKPVLRKYSY